MKKIFVSIICLLVVGLLVFLIFFNKSESIVSTVNLNDIKYESNELEDNIPEDAINIDLSNIKNTDYYTYSNSVLTIGSGGVYNLTGTLNGSIIIDTKSDVRLILNGVTIKSENYSAIYVKNANKVIITLYEGTKNYIEDTSNYTNLSNDEPNGTIFSHDDLVINGGGELNLSANYEDGIVSKDNLKILNGVINIESNDDAIRGKDSLVISGGTFNIKSNGVGLKSTNEDEGLGFIYITDGTFNIESTKDSINAVNDVIIDSGELTISSGDDGIHSDTNLVINGGNINIVKSYEGLEGNNIEINGGDISVIASDDGMNAAGGNDSSGFGPMNDQFKNNSTSSTSKIVITGGSIYIDSKGDGVDSNGSIEMSGGTLIVDGPTDSGNGALDYDKTFNITGGTLIASGSNGMMQTPSQTSSQNTISIVTSLSKGTPIHIESSDGNDVITYVPTKNIQSVVISTSNIELGKTYNIYTGGSCDGDSGICSNYKLGTLLTSLQVSNTVTSYGSVSGIGVDMNIPMNEGDMNKRKMR